MKKEEEGKCEKPNNTQYTTDTPLTYMHARPAMHIWREARLWR